jgi:hypothetical protein
MMLALVTMLQISRLDESYKEDRRHLRSLLPAPLLRLGLRIRHSGMLRVTRSL